MANRVIQQKVLKLKKAVRVAPKRYDASLIRVHAPVNHETMIGYSNRAVSGVWLEQYFMKGTTSLDEARMRARNAYIQAMCPSLCVDPNTGKPFKENGPRQQSQALRRATEALNDVAVEKNVVIQRSVWHKVCLLWNDKGTYYCLVWVDHVSATLKRSLNYPSRDAIMAVWEGRDNKNIVWKKPIPLTG